MMEILYFRGLKALYNESAHGNGIYFATDTQEIIHNGLIYSGKIPQELLNQVQSNTDKLEILTNDSEGSVQNQINDAINDFAQKISDDGTVNTFKELVDYAAENGAELDALLIELEEVKESNLNLENEIILLKEEDARLLTLIEDNTKAINDLSNEVDRKIESAFSWQDVN